MINFFVFLYLCLPKLPVVRSLPLVSRGVRGGVRLSANWLLRLWFFFSRPFMSSGVDSNERFVVSLTSFPARINTVHLCIETLLRQERKPKSIVLWLSLDQFSDKRSLPKSLLSQEKRGLKIVLREGDLRSHKKYFYAFEEYRDSLVLTVDDDVLYSSKLTEDLFRASTRNPGRIVGNQVKKIAVRNGEILPYLDWVSFLCGGANTVNIPVGVGGVLYPPGVLCKEFRRAEILMRLAPKADDLWLGVWAMYSSVPVVPSGKEELEQIPLTIFSDQTLFSSNGLGGNDVQLNDILNWGVVTLGRDLKREIILKNS